MSPTSVLHSLFCSFLFSSLLFASLLLLYVLFSHFPSLLVPFFSWFPFLFSPSSFLFSCLFFSSLHLYALLRPPHLSFFFSRGHFTQTLFFDKLEYSALWNELLSYGIVTRLYSLGTSYLSHRGRSVFVTCMNSIQLLAIPSKDSYLFLSLILSS